MRSKDIEHYGVLGMKWGIRRTPEQLGHHKIKKGTVIYRTTANSDEKLFGSKYVTYLPPDRDLYRGGYSSVIRSRGKNSNRSVYEKTYVLKEDLNIPSRVTLENVYKKVMSNESTRKKAIKGFIDSSLDRDVMDYKLNYGSEWKKYLDKDKKMMVDQTLTNWANYSPEDAFSIAARSLGPSSPIVKDSVIKELKSQGYNAMVDEASVGGRGRSPREGVEPLIIFNSETSLKEVSTSVISERESKEATKRYSDWRRVANQHKSKPW